MARYSSQALQREIIALVRQQQGKNMSYWEVLGVLESIKLDVAIGTWMMRHAEAEDEEDES